MSKATKRVEKGRFLELTDQPRSSSTVLEVRRIAADLLDDAIGHLVLQVADNAVIGVPDDDYGQRLAAFVVPKRRAGLEGDSIRDYLKDKVSRFERPRDITIVESIPRNAAGKVLRSRLTDSR